MYLHSTNFYAYELLLWISLFQYSNMTLKDTCWKKNAGNVDENIPSEKKSTHIHIPFIGKNECVVLETESNLVGYFVSYFVLISNSICLMFTARRAVYEEMFTMHTLSLICKDWICYFSQYNLFLDSKCMLTQAKFQKLWM